LFADDEEDGKEPEPEENDKIEVWFADWFKH
jgi:hypothetical protein